MTPEEAQKAAAKLIDEVDGLTDGNDALTRSLADSIALALNTSSGSDVMENAKPYTKCPA